MSDSDKNISSKTEFIIVVSLSFGYSILISLLMFINSFFSSSAAGLPFTNESHISLILYEILILIVVITFLNMRGNPIDYNNNTTLFRLIGGSILLTIFYYFIYFLLLTLIADLLPQESSLSYSEAIINEKIHPFIIIATSIVNPVFEELIVAGYVISALRHRKGVLFAVNASVLIRFLYHLYQGPAAALSIIPMGLIFAFVYVRWKNIWPLVIAHGIMDFISLYTYGS